MLKNSDRQAQLNEMGSAVKVAERPLRRRFLIYAIESGQSGGLELVESYEEYDATQSRYLAKEVRSVLPEQIASQISVERRTELARYCSILRRELDQAGLKMFFDPVGRDLLRPKWRYRLAGHTYTDYVVIEEDSDIKADSYTHNPDTLPSWVINLVQCDYRYYLTPEWRNWFGRKMQRKREEIIIQRLLEII